MKDRDVSIDILKFLAVILVTNSHMDILYVKFSAFATGGTIGDVLFLFCSGFTLFMKPISSIREFPNWYKRRINRIYPSILAIAIISCIIFNNNSSIVNILLFGGGSFIAFIMIYYIIIFMIGLYCNKIIFWIICFVSALSCICFFFIDRPFPFNMYGDCYLKWIVYFIFMLLGAKMGKNEIFPKASSSRNLLYSFIGIAFYYAFYFLGLKIQSIEYIEVFNFIPLLFAVYYLYQWGNGDFAKSLYNSKIGYFFIRFIGGLCLEVYLIQSYIIKDSLNFLFPLSIPIIFCAIILAAYISRCFARFISQTFKEAPYNWKKLFDRY